jgi:hypothetical protein
MKRDEEAMARRQAWATTASGQCIFTVSLPFLLAAERMADRLQTT